ncbi:MAG: sulfoxide reductase heme-binding subunit YedZ [Proteobacteria bacterium]|nr:sulfoxide reductase heme-binding subunit YedZ [Pseudomonadota bacterium]
MTSAQAYRWLIKPAVFAVFITPALWLAAGALGVAGVSLGVDPVRSLVHENGTMALRMLVATLAITPLRQLTGHSDLLRLRRMLGLFAFFYALLHLSSWVVFDQGMDLQMILSEVVKRPYLLVGLSAVLLMLPLALTSTTAAQRWLKRRWTQLHRLTYVIAVLAVWHFWWQVKKDLREPIAYAVIVAVLLGWRVWKRPRAAKARSAPATTQGTA